MYDFEIDFDSLRKDLIDYFGSASIYNPTAIMNLVAAEQATYSKLLEIASKNKFNLDKYCNKIKRKY